MHDGVFFCMANEWVLLGAVSQSIVVIADATRKAVESCRAYLAVLPDNHAAYFRGRVFTPSGNVECEVDKSLIPLIAHRLTNPHTSARAISPSTKERGGCRWINRTRQEGYLAGKATQG